MNRQILVVDDEESLRELICVCLQDLGGWDVLLAASGQEALGIAASHPVDAILLDVSMPHMDGIECYENLKAHPDSQHIPIILLTAKVLPDDRTRFAQLEIAGLITKPFDPTLISRQVATLLGWET